MATNLETKIGRIRNNVTSALAKIAEKGVTVPEGAGSDDLEGLIDAITGGGSASIPVCSVNLVYDRDMCGPNALVFTRFVNGEIRASSVNYDTTTADVVCGSLAYVYGQGAGTFWVNVPDGMEIIPNNYTDEWGTLFLVRMPSTPGNYTIECYVE